MTTITDTRYSSPTRFHDGQVLTADSLDLQHAVIGDGLMLTQDKRERFVLHSLESGHAEPLGAFATAAQALARLDALES